MTTDLLLDSGAFSAKTQKKELNIDEYIDYIKENEGIFTRYFNLDVIGDGAKSYQNFLYMRKRGLDPIPVWHAETEPRYLLFYLERCDYVAIGAISVMSNERTMKSLNDIWWKYLTDKEGYPVCKVHGFGLTSILIMRRYPWYSVDSTSWVQFGRYGVVLIPQTRNKGTMYAYDENPHIVTVSLISPRISEASKHIMTVSDDIKEKYIKYIESRGFKLGKSEVEYSPEETIEVIIEEGVSNNHLLRDKLNMLYYRSVEESMPEYPWRFIPEVIPNEFA